MDLLTGFEKIVRRSEPLAMHTWFQLGGPADYFAEPRNVEELVALVRRCREEDAPVRTLGRGSNILVRDEGVPGMVIRLSEPAFANIEVAAGTITAAAGPNWAGSSPRRSTRDWPGWSPWLPSPVRSAARCTATPVRTVATSDNGSTRLRSSPAPARSVSVIARKCSSTTARAASTN